MQSLALSPAPTFSLLNRQANSAFCCLQSPNRVVLPNRRTFFSVAPATGFNQPRVSINEGGMNKKRGFSTVCSAAALAPHDLQWISTVAAAILVIARGTAIHKSFLVPLFALQAPASVISWMKNEYGLWSAFLAILVRLFFALPGELELPFFALLLVIVAPHEVLKITGRKEGQIIYLAIAAYLAFQHISGTGSFQKAFDLGSIVATIAIICITVVACLILI